MDEAREKLVIVGASGHGRIALEIAQAAGLVAAGFVDKAFSVGAEIDGLPILAQDPQECAQLLDASCDWFAGVGDNAIRRALSEEIRVLTGRSPVNLIHPSAVVSPRAVLGEGIMVSAGAVVCTGSRLGEGVIVNTGATVDHDCDLQPYAKVSPGCSLAGQVTVGAAALIGTGACVIPGIKIGAGAMVGAGAVVIRDIPPGVVAYGNPARARRRL
jgi:UDP-N-acetylbacillosamine N-acetyltransferase